MPGTGRLIQLILRRDRVKLPLLIVLFVSMLLAMIPMLQDMYGAKEALQSAYSVFSVNPSMLFMTGPMDAPTFGAFMTVETLLWWGLVIAFINTMFVIRHTRHNEEIGAQELLLSGQAHRGSGLLAALIVALLMNILIAIITGFGMTFEYSWTSESAWLYGVAMGMFGMVWASIAAIVAQLTQSGRSANGMLAALIGIGFLVRGIGDFMGKIGSSGMHEPIWISYLSPFGWLQMTRPLVDPEWWPLLIMGGAVVVCIGLAFILLGTRDVGSGLLPSRSGKPRASEWLRLQFGHSWYLQRGVFVGWLIGVLVMVLTIGALVPQIDEVFGSSGEDSVRRTMIEAIGGVGEMVPAFMSAMIMIMALMVIGYALHAMMRLRNEESNGHLESLLATGVSRIGWLGRHISVVLSGSAIMLVATGFILATILGTMSDVAADLGEYMLAGLSYLPLVAFFVGLYVFLFGLMPRFATAVMWTYFGFVAFVSWLGPMLNLLQWVLNLSITEYVSSPPVEAIDGQSLVIIGLIAAVMMVSGGVIWRRRDLYER